MIFIRSAIGCAVAAMAIVIMSLLFAHQTPFMPIPVNATGTFLSWMLAAFLAGMIPGLMFLGDTQSDKEINEIVEDTKKQLKDLIKDNGGAEQ